MNAEQALRKKREAEEASRTAERKAGERDEVLRSMKEQFGCATLEQAEAKLAEVERSLSHAEGEAERLGRRWDKKWGGRCGQRLSD